MWHLIKMIMTIAMWQITFVKLMLRNYNKRDTAMGWDISYCNNATLCVNRLEESVRVFSSGHVSILGFDRPCGIQQIHQDFGSRVLVSRKHSYRVRLDWSQALVWESIWLEERKWTSLVLLFAFPNQVLVFNLTVLQSCRHREKPNLDGFERLPPYRLLIWHKSFKTLKPPPQQSSRVKSN